MNEASARMIDDPVDRTLDESGTVLGDRYRLMRPLGEGGAGIVYAASDERIGAEVAIKVVRGSARRDEITLARFHREARAAGKLGHPNIVRVTDFGTSADGSPYVVMERLDGETLEARVQRLGKLDPATAVDVHIQLADALAAAHSAGVLHRDVKPANVFLTQLATGKVLVKLLDFGLAELYQEPLSPRLTERGLLVGSLAYLAPERVLGGTADEQSDVYGIGASLYESLSGALPFAASNPMMMRAQILGGELAPLEGVSKSLSDLTRACLARDASERVKTAADVRRRLLVAEVPPSKTPTRSSRPPAVVSAPVAGSSPWPWVVAFVVAAALAIGALVTITGETDVAVAPPSTIAVAPPTSITAPPSTIAVAPPTSIPVVPPTSIATVPPIVVPRATTVRATRPAPSLVSPPATEAPAPTAPTAEPSRFDHIQEPDWGTPVAN